MLEKQIKKGCKNETKKKINNSILTKRRKKKTKSNIFRAIFCTPQLFDT